MDYRPDNEESLEPVGPYVGLRPYEEYHRHIFFGREEERDILIDKLIANKLTLLFAATGVGKSSLLRAGVIPALKHKKKEGLDVVYYCDWVSDPLVHLKKETMAVLRAQQKIAEDYPLYRESEDISLKKFFRLAAAFASEPLVVILDQFEEFFQYRRYKENFIKFIEEFSECVNDRERQVVFLVSMREDFALELNVFKKYLPTMLFENYYRLEKLTTAKAGEAIVKPVEPLGFQYEEKLLETLLTDLAKREEEARMGAAPAALAKYTPAYVEPPYLQIVCSRLWEIDRDNPGKKIHLESYEQMGGARGFVDSYFHEVMNRFSLSEKKIASSAFDLPITPRGTKMAYTAEDLADRIGINEKSLGNILENLRKSRILRSHKREGAIWYELYHDIFSNIINIWNKKFTTTTSYYLRLSAKETISDRIEIYIGNLKVPELYNMHKYQSEAQLERSQVEVDKLFIEKQIGDFEQLNRELIGHLPLIDRISAYWAAGDIKKTLDLAKASISENDLIRSRQVIDLLQGFGTKKSYELLKERLGKSYSNYLRKKIFDALTVMPPSLIIEDFIGLLEDQYTDVRELAAFTLGQMVIHQALKPILCLFEDPEYEVRSSAAKALGNFGSNKAVAPLIGLLKDPESDVRNSATKALGWLGSEKSVKSLLGLLKDLDADVRSGAAEALGRIGNEKAVEPLLGLLKNKNLYVRSSAAEALGNIGCKKAVEPLLGLLKDPESGVRNSATEALGKLGNEKVVEPLMALLKDSDKDVRSCAVEALGKIGCDKAVEPLIELLRNPDNDIRTYATEALGQIGSEKVIDHLMGLLKDPDNSVRSCAAEALGELGNEKAVKPILDLLKDPDENVRSSAVEVLGQIGSEKAVETLMILLTDQDKYMRISAAEAIGTEETVLPLLELLKDQDKYVRFNTAKALGQFGICQSMAPLLNLLKDPDSNVRSSAAEALGALGSNKSVDPLLNLLKDPDSNVRSSAAETLGVIGNDKALAPLIGLLKDQASEVMLRAVDEVGQFGSDEALELLSGLLDAIDYNVRSNAAEALGKLGSYKAVEFLVRVIRDWDDSIRDSAAAALGRIGSVIAIEPLVSLVNDIEPEVQKSAVLSLGKLSARDKIDIIKNRYLKQNENFTVRIAAAATLLKWGDDSGLEYLKEISKIDNINKRIEVANALGEVPSKQGNSMLLEMLADENTRVKGEVISSLGNTKDKFSLSYLHNMIQYPNTRIRAAVVEALAEIADPECIEPLKKIAANTGEPIATRLKAIIGLSKIQHQDALKALLELLDNENSTLQYKTIMAIGKNPPAASLPGHLRNRLKARLNDKLKVLEERKARWRKIRDENTDSYNEEKRNDWNQRLEEVEPNEPLEFELAFALSRIDPFHEGTKFLGHPFANVREGAWLGIGKSRDVSQIEELYWKRKQSDVPWFIHAAYRAIDHILMNIEAFGGKDELNRLESLYKKLSAEEGKNFHEGVQTRMEWTIERLRELDSKK